MKSEDAMVLWTPNREPHLGNPTRGLVALATVPDNAETARYALSVGACDLGWREKTEQERQQALRHIATRIVEDNIGPEAVAMAFSQIEGWAGAYR